MLLVQHGPCYFEDVTILAFDYVLLRCLSVSEFSPNFFLEKVCRECVGEVFLYSVSPKIPYMEASFLFDFAFDNTSLFCLMGRIHVCLEKSSMKVT